MGLFKFFYNSDDHWRKASKRIIWLWLGQIIFWIAAISSVSSTASKTSDAKFISFASFSGAFWVFFIVANILITFNYFRCLRRDGNKFEAFRNQKNLLWIDLLCCWLPIVIVTKFFFWRNYRRMAKK